MKLLQRAIADRRVSLAWWSVGVVIYCGFIVAVWPVIDGNEDFQDVYAEMPDALMAMFGADGFIDFTSPPGFLNTYLYSMILPFIFVGLAVSLGAALIGGQEEDHLLDLVLAYPVSRRRLVVESVAALLVGVLILGLVTWVVLAVAREPVDLDVGLAGLASATIGSMLFAAMCGLAALFAGAVTGSKGLGAGAGWGVALASYLVNILANLDDSLDWLEPLSPLYWATADSPVTGTVPAWFLALVAVAASLSVATGITFERHDLH